MSHAKDRALLILVGLFFAGLAWVFWRYTGPYGFFILGLVQPFCSLIDRIFARRDTDTSSRATHTHEATKPGQPTAIDGSPVAGSPTPRSDLESSSHF